MTGYVTNNLDCEDTSVAINLSGTEICDGIDNDCDTMTDENVIVTYYQDVDGDLYGNPFVST